VNSCGDTRSNGQNTANAFLVPLVGGSGGAGGDYVHTPLSNTDYGGGGGAGGGAILVASSTTITGNGAILSRGGRALGGFCPGGGGAGGSIHLAASTITGGGQLSTQGLQIGMIRREAFTDTFIGSVEGTQHNGSPFNLLIPTAGPPSVIVSKVNGINVTQP